jgi:hypothetical protein
MKIFMLIAVVIPPALKRVYKSRPKGVSFRITAFGM